jgi:hypothetical protein
VQDVCSPQWRTIAHGRRLMSDSIQTSVWESHLRWCLRGFPLEAWTPKTDAVAVTSPGLKERRSCRLAIRSTTAGACRFQRFRSLFHAQQHPPRHDERGWFHDAHE